MPRTRKILTAILVFNALSAIGGGTALVTGTLPVPVALLHNTPFDSYVVPGLFLGVVIGGSSAIGAVAARRQGPRMHPLSAGAGFIMIGWIVGEAILIEGFSVLQGIYLLTGVLVVAASATLHHRAVIAQSEGRARGAGARRPVKRSPPGDAGR
ncbi:hypothetical protein [Cellulomonas cellasea]|uniref:Uncharacterized protein n=2 Tax=Cellulomonas cellasea TaxID=43670 RepID=A0A0A0BC76_9CELL|nr:hypothetical protein [Cellulomonas cellasea]KGM03717.1 hypothetical protein Q760_14805 [Cellulomonas cellasea DSM 20118]GEA86922.1 hypothetical protein CCE01nite_08710 [Cellulomonas cellasea]